MSDITFACELKGIFIHNIVLNYNCHMAVYLSLKVFFFLKVNFPGAQSRKQQLLSFYTKTITGKTENENEKKNNNTNKN